MRTLAFRLTTSCAYCGRDFGPGRKKTKDHIIPKSLGITHYFITVAACEPCNQIKSDLTPSELRARARALAVTSDLLLAIADRVDELVEERSLPAPWRE